MHLDFATVLVLHPLSLIVGAICLLYLRWHAPQHRGLGNMAAAFLIVAAGALLAGISERHQWGSGIWTLFSFASVPFAYTLFWISLRNLVHERPAGRWLLLLLLPAVLVLLAALTGFYLVGIYRAIAYISVMSGFALAGAWVVMSDPLEERLSSRHALAVVLCIKPLIGLVMAIGLINPDLALMTMAQTFSVLILCQFATSMFVVILVQERVERRLIRLSETDALTRVHNRRWLHDRLPQRAVPGDAFVVIDIDHFKAVNDRHGHAAGDHVLTMVAQTMAGLLSRDALFARMGGEEFGLFLPRHVDVKPGVIAETLRQAVAVLPVVFHEERIPVTISLGLGMASRDTSLTALMAKADEALYAAKRGGRNRVVCFRNAVSGDGAPQMPDGQAPDRMSA
ncbi:diguanylate cyclase (GGDEF) domain-containing protein [Rhizobium sp. RU35A]|uniref:GGDEF domain-containing protein n=1 Tax=Rhizobium sp. RU35A TaxID=1907414 RepID=UPI0009555356|nr:GGDEF domain-containing protein [Rhizobium sp. RU35A]SIQ21402.1 diguanylate cyclase (GGDEF) domain-containing protein [Rhizobium sp. RU35A]